MPDQNQTTSTMPGLASGGTITIWSTHLSTAGYLLSSIGAGESSVTTPAPYAANTTGGSALTACATRLQSTQEYLNTSSAATLSMIAISGISTFSAWMLFVYGCWLIGNNSKLWLKKGNYMMTISLYPVLSSLAFLGILCPASSMLCQAMDTAYVAVVLWKLAKSMVAGLGGKDGLARVASGTQVSLRSPPCCCCCVCLPTKDVSRRFINVVMMLLLQCLFIRPMLMGIVAVLWISGTYDPSPLSPHGAFWCVTIVSTTSFLLAMYGLLLLLRVTRAYSTVTLVAGRFITVVLVILTTTVANFIINLVLVANGVIRCTVDAPANQVSSGYFHFTANLLILGLCGAAIAVYRQASRRGAKTSVELDDDREQLRTEVDKNVQDIAISDANH